MKELQLENLGNIQGGAGEYEIDFVGAAFGDPAVFNDSVDDDCNGTTDTTTTDTAKLTRD
jgi:hypothetical protein